MARNIRESTRRYDTEEPIVSGLLEEYEDEGDIESPDNISRGEKIAERASDLLYGRTQLDYRIYSLSKKKKIAFFIISCLGVAGILGLFLYIAL